MSDPNRARNVPMLKHSGKKSSTGSSRKRKNPLLKEKTHLTRMLYLLGKEKGHRHGYLSQPAVMKKLFHPLVKDPKILRRTDADIKQAVNMWCDPDTHEQAEDKYGDIRYWNVSRVTNMRDLFYNKTTFNDDISRWNVSAVTNMQSMFDSASAFNQNISKWDVSAVTNMDAMFNYASAFNQNLNRWNVSNVRDMRLMFFSAVSFNGNISGWNVGNVTDMEAMFSQAESFERNISGWDVENVTNMESIFEDCPIPEHNKPPSMRVGGGGRGRGTRKKVGKP